MNLKVSAMLQIVRRVFTLGGGGCACGVFLKLRTLDGGEETVGKLANNFDTLCVLVEHM